MPVTQSAGAQIAVMNYLTEGIGAESRGRGQRGSVEAGRQDSNSRAASAKK